MSQQIPHNGTTEVRAKVMKLLVEEALKQIDHALAKFDEVEKQYSKGIRVRGSESSYIDPPTIVESETITILKSTLRRFVPDPDYAKQALEGNSLRYLAGALKALRSDYEHGRLQTFRQMVQSDLFSDFLEMAEYLLEDKLKDPAAVIAGGVLEEHLRKLCDKNGVDLADKPKLDTMNADLAKKGAYGKNEQKQITAWAGVRNSAAHGKYNEYSLDQVTLMVEGIRQFLGKIPA
jgi:hypothetical protein